VTDFRDAINRLLAESGAAVTELPNLEPTPITMATRYYCGWVWSGGDQPPQDIDNLHRFHMCRREQGHEGNDHACRWCEDTFEEVTQ
jgi:hypothetical protein